MKLRTSLALYRASFFAVLGLAPLSACGGATSDKAGGGAGGNDSGAVNTAGGVSSGGYAAAGATGSGAFDARADATSAGGDVDAAADGPSGETGTIGRTAPDGGFLSCDNPTPLLGLDGEPTGYVQCEGGSLHRVAHSVSCVSALPREGICQTTSGSASGCTRDSDCTARAYGYCQDGYSGCQCRYGCAKDADCPMGEVCLCSDPVGVCVSSNCKSDTDCGDGLCLSYLEYMGCGPAFACQTTSDNCVSNADCGNFVCTLIGPVDHHQCAACIGMGRPFLVAAQARVAAAAPRADWSSQLAPNVSKLPSHVRSEIARYWSEVALMEHASIAAFARFALELLSLGAPLELVTSANSAMADETRHAQDAFALATAYAGAPVGPGPLAIEGALGTRSPIDVVRTAILEGCIGETVATIEAAEALARAQDTAVRDVLARICDDERRHAELAWRFIRWVLSDGPDELRETAAHELETVVCGELAMQSELSLREAAPVLACHGVLERSARAEIRRRVLTDVVLPCARGILRTRSAAPRAIDSRAS